MTKILAIGAHPDDIEFGCGGLMIKEAEKGSQIKYLICSLGEAGSNGTAEGRKAESAEAAKFVGADIEFLDLGGDSHIAHTPQNAYQIARAIRQFKPNIVIAPSLVPHQHPDHLAVGQLSYSATRYARYGGLAELKDFPPHAIDAFYYYAIHAELGQGPDIIIDVSAAHDKWEQAMKLHTSQMKTKAYLDLVSSKAAYYGKATGVDYAIGLWKDTPVRVDYISDLTLSSRNY